MRHKNDHDAPRVVYHKVSLSVDNIPVTNLYQTTKCTFFWDSFVTLLFRYFVIFVAVVLPRTARKTVLYFNIYVSIIVRFVILLSMLFYQFNVIHDHSQHGSAELL